MKVKDILEKIEINQLNNECDVQIIFGISPSNIIGKDIDREVEDDLWKEELEDYLICEDKGYILEKEVENLVINLVGYRLYVSLVLKDE